MSILVPSHILLHLIERDVRSWRRCHFVPVFLPSPPLDLFPTSFVVSFFLKLLSRLLRWIRIAHATQILHLLAPDIGCGGTTCFIKVKSPPE